jgi:hypothetical protein
LKFAANANTQQIYIAPFFQDPIGSRHCFYLQYIQEQLLGSWQQEPKQTAKRSAAEALAKFQISNFHVRGTRKSIWWLDFA